MTQNYITNSHLFLQYGTDKAIPELFGEYVYYGPNRIVEGVIDLTGASYPAGMSTTSTTPTIVSNTTFFPSPPAGQLFIEKVEVVAEVALASGTSFNIGLIQNDRATIPTNYGTAFINAEVTATLNAAGKAQIYTNGTTHAGGLIGSSAANATGPYYISAYTTGTFTTGVIRVRVYYHALNPLVTGSNITQ